MCLNLSLTSVILMVLLNERNLHFLGRVGFRLFFKGNFFIAISALTAFFSAN